MKTVNANGTWLQTWKHSIRIRGFSILMWSFMRGFNSLHEHWAHGQVWVFGTSVLDVLINASDRSFNVKFLFLGIDYDGGGVLLRAHLRLFFPRKRHVLRLASWVMLYLIITHATLVGYAISTARAYLEYRFDGLSHSAALCEANEFTDNLLRNAGFTDREARQTQQELYAVHCGR